MLSKHETTISRDKLNIQRPLGFGFATTIYFLTTDYWLTAIGLGWAVFLFFLFLSRLGKGFPVLELMLLMASLQWVVGAKIAYLQGAEHFKYYMYVEESQYMKLVVPGIVSFSLGVLLFFPKYSFQVINHNLQQYVNENRTIPYKLIALGLLSAYLGPYVPPVIGFIFYLTTAFQYVGLVLLLFMSRSNRKWYLFLAILALLVISSILKGMFHDLILWSALLFSFISIQLRLNLLSKIAAIFFGLAMAFIIQSVKSEYRSQAGGYNDEQKLSLFGELVSKKFVEAEDDDETLYNMNFRLNQGWIISAVLDNVPQYEPYANGESIMVALKASWLPRFLDPGKKQAGGRENFRRFTGLQIRNDTSMGTSIIGEAYANYGFIGSYIFMFIWGAFLAYGFSKLIKYSRKRPIIVAFIPLVFLQVIKAETELAVVLNHFVKSSVLVFGFLWMAEKFLGWKFKVNH